MRTDGVKAQQRGTVMAEPIVGVRIVSKSNFVAELLHTRKS